MANKKSTPVSENPDFEQFYKVIRSYVENCIQVPKTKLTVTKKGNTSSIEIESDEKDLQSKLPALEDQTKSSQTAFYSMCADISNGGVPYLSVYTDAIKKLYTEESDWKRDIKLMLVNPKSLKLFKDARSNLVDLYPLLITINKAFPVDDYSELSTSPKAALYGSEVNKTKNGSTKKAPLKNEDIQAMLNAFLQVKDDKLFSEWVMAILCFDFTQLTDGFQSEYIPMREQLKEWVYNQIPSSESYKHAVMDALLKGNKLKSLLDTFASQPSILAKQTELEERIKQLEESNAKENAEYHDQYERAHVAIQERDTKIADLQLRARDFERCKQQLTDYIGRYQTQVEINERITADNIRRLNEIETDYDHMQDELANANDRLETIEAEHSALQSDFSLKNNELLRLKELSSQKEAAARIDIMRELVSGINEQFFYLTMFYLELKDTGKLSPESIELYADTLNNIDSVLAELGIKKIGIIDQKVSFDSSIYISTDAKLANGEQVQVRGYGWKICDEVYIKAAVEKGE